MQKNPASKSTEAHSAKRPNWKRIAIRLRAMCQVLALTLIAASAMAEDPPALPVQVQAAMLDGTAYSLADSRGSVTVLVIWSPDSLASRKCIWELQRFAPMYVDRGVTTLAISNLDEPDALRQFVAKRKLSLPVGILGNNTLGPLPEQRLPIVYVFDRDGRLQSTRAGLFSLRSLEHLVEPLVRQ